MNQNRINISFVNQYFHGFDISHHKPLCGSRFKVMPPRKRKLHQTVENVSVNNKKKIKKMGHVHVTTTSTESTAEATYQAKNSNADTATLTMGHLEPPALQSLSYESGQKPVSLPLSSGLQSTISSVTLNGECDHDPLPIRTFNDLYILYQKHRSKKMEFRVHRFGSFAASELFSKYGIYGYFNNS